MNESANTESGPGSEVVSETGDGCPVCEADTSSHRPHFSEEEWRVVRCDECGMVFLANPPDYKAQADEHPWGDCYAQETAARQEREPWLYALHDATKRPRRLLRSKAKLPTLCRRYLGRGAILDLGCRTGRRMRALLMNHGLEIIPYGIEIDPGTAAEADEAFRAHGGRTECAPAVEALSRWPEASLDGALLHAYLEHEKQPKAVMARLHRALKPESFVVIKVPNHGCMNRRFRGERWCGYRLPDHVCYFSPSTLRRVVEEAGFQIERFGLFDRFPFSDNMWLVARKVGRELRRAFMLALAGLAAELFCDESRSQELLQAAQVMV